MRRRGFTLLEVVIALAILAMSLMAIFNLNSGAIAAHVFTKRLTIASLLARSKMTDLEQELYDKGFSNDDDEQDGDFSAEGWPKMKWRAKIIAPKTQGLSPQQLIGAIFGLPMGGAGESSMGPLGALFGADGAKGAAEAGGAGGDALAALGPAAGMAQGQFGQMVDQLAQAVREVHLTVTWKEGSQTESIDLVTHVVALGPGSDRNGGAAAANPAAAAAQQALTGCVNQLSGAPVASPTPGPGGAMIDPADGAPCIPLAQFQALRGGFPRGGGVVGPGARGGKNR